MTASYNPTTSTNNTIATITSPPDNSNTIITPNFIRTATTNTDITAITITTV